jgi:starvation-inducible DNA-binding protein
MAKAVATHKRFQAHSTAVEREISRENKPDSAVVQSLQRQVANAFVLYANYKHYHWQTYGPLFRDLHLFFDELAKGVLATVDEFAERIRMIGQDPIFSPQDVIDHASLKISDSGLTMKQMIEEAKQNLAVVIKEMRDGAREAEEADDPGTVDLFSRSVQVHEKYEWWLRDILENGDGLTA